MNSNSFKPIAAILGAAACLASSIFAAPAPAPAQNRTLAQSVVPNPQDTAGNANPGMGTPSTVPPSGSTSAVTALTDAQILGVMNAVDGNEIAAAKAALKEKLGPDAKSYAKMLKQQHSDNSDATKKLAKKLALQPETSAKAEELREKGKQELTAMTPKNGKEFETAYVDAMVNGHTEVLQLIDTQLAPFAQNEEVKNHVAEMRQHVSAHLEQGKRLQEGRVSQGAQGE